MDDKGKIVRFTRYETLTGGPGTPIPEEAHPVIRPGANWLAEELYNQAMKPSPWADVNFPPLSRRERLRLWLNRRLPRMHFGPCDHSDCE